MPVDRSDIDGDDCRREFYNRPSGFTVVEHDILDSIYKENAGDSRGFGTHLSNAFQEDTSHFTANNDEDTFVEAKESFVKKMHDAANKAKKEGGETSTMVTGDAEIANVDHFLENVFETASTEEEKNFMLQYVTLDGQELEDGAEAKFSLFGKDHVQRMIHACTQCTDQKFNDAGVLCTHADEFRCKCTFQALKPGEGYKPRGKPAIPPGSGKVTVAKLAYLADDHGVAHFKRQFVRFGERQGSRVSSLSGFASNFLDSLMHAAEEVFLDYDDYERVALIETGYVKAMDLALEPADMEYLFCQGWRGLEQFQLDLEGKGKQQTGDPDEATLERQGSRAPPIKAAFASSPRTKPAAKNKDSKQVMKALDEQRNHDADHEMRMGRVNTPGPSWKFSPGTGGITGTAKKR